MSPKSAQFAFMISPNSPLRYELFRGNLCEIAFQASETNLSEFVKARSNAKPHLTELA